MIEATPDEPELGLEPQPEPPAQRCAYDGGPPCPRNTPDCPNQAGTGCRPPTEE